MILRLEDGSSAPTPPRAGLKLWLKADAGVTQAAGTVSAWNDQSGNGNNVVANGDQPAFNASSINGKPGITFSGQYLTRNSSPLSSGSSPRTVIVVSKSGSGGTMLCFGKDGAWFGPACQNFGAPGSTALYLGNTGFSTLNGTDTSSFSSIPLVCEVGWTGSGAITYAMNSHPIAVTGANGNADGSDFISIGNYYNGGPGALPFQGDICEVLLYDHVLTAGDIRSVRVYLQAKYAIDLGIGTIAMMPLGDSITDGWSNPDGNGYRKFLTDALPKLHTYGPNPNEVGGSPYSKFYWHAGYNGFTSAEIATHSTTLFSQFFFADVVTLHIGTNDFAAADNPTGDPNYTVTNVQTIIDNFFAARTAPETPLYFFVMLTIYGGSASTNDALNSYVTALRPLLSAALAGQSNVYVVQPPAIPDDEFLSGQFGIHPLADGYAKMANDGAGHGWVPAMISAGLN